MLCLQWGILGNHWGLIKNVPPHRPPLSPFSLTMADLVNNHSNPKAEMRMHVERRTADHLILPSESASQNRRVVSYTSTNIVMPCENSGDWILPNKRMRKPQGSSISVDQPKGRRSDKVSEKQKEFTLPLIGQSYFQYPQWVGICTSIVYTHMTAENKHCVGHTHSML
jgi:hypothetical protein